MSPVEASSIGAGPTRILVAGVDSSTQSTKVTVRDLATGRQVRAGRAAHPAGTIVDPNAWWDALLTAVSRAGGLDDVAAISVAGQRHPPAPLEPRPRVDCASPLWNDPVSHASMLALNEELGRREWIRRTGLPITLSDTAPKLRWLRDTRPRCAERTAAVALVHDWLTWRLMGHGDQDGGDIGALTTDRSEASGTAYWDGRGGRVGTYCQDLVELSLGHRPHLPRVLGPLDVAGATGAGIAGVPQGIPVGVGAGDNAAAALALGACRGDVIMSLGTSGNVYARSAEPTYDYSGHVCSYASATGDYLPLAATLNATRNFDVGAALLGITCPQLDELALAAPPGAGGLTLLPFFEGERTPDLPRARASLHGMSLGNLSPGNLARAIIEGTLAGQVAMLDNLADCGLPAERLVLIGGGARSSAVQQILPTMVGTPVVVPVPDEYVAKGAAMQAASTVTGDFPVWGMEMVRIPESDYDSLVRDQYDSAMRAMGYEPY